MISNNFIYPEIYCPLLKDYFKGKKTNSYVTDFTEKFISKVLNSKYLFKKMRYSKLNKEENKIIKRIDDCIKVLRNSNSNSEDILSANMLLFSVLDLYSKDYNIKWVKQGIFFSRNIKRIEDIDYLLNSNSCKIFEDIFMDELLKIKNEDFIYINVAYDYQLVFSLFFAKIIKKSYPKTFITLGGNYMTHIKINLKHLMLKYNYIDSVYYGYNPSNLYNIYRYYLNRNGCKFNGFVRCNDKIIKSNCNINDKCLSLVPCYEDYNLDVFLSKEKTIPLIMNFGCYYNKCNFCSHKFFYNSFCELDKLNVFNYIKFQYFYNGIKNINFVDECISAKTLDDLCNFILENKINIKWIIETRFDSYFLDISNTKKLYLAGCRLISFGLESYNADTLKKMNKGIDKRIVKKCLKNVYNSGIETSITCMVGYPKENLLKTVKTLSFIKNCKYIDNFGLNKFLLVRNSKLSKDYSFDLSDLNLVLKYNYKYYLNSIIYLFNKSYKIKKYLNIRNNVIHRIQYLYLDRHVISLNYRKVVK